MQNDCGTIEHVDAAEALQERNGRVVSHNHVGDGGLNQALEESCCPRAKAFVEPLRGNRHPHGSGHLCQLLQSSGWIVEPAEDQRLRELRSRELRCSLHKSGLGSQLIRCGAQQTRHSPAQFSLRAHSALLPASSGRDPYGSKMEPPGFLRLMQMESAAVASPLSELAPLSVARAAATNGRSGRS
jgi:hypothetical protein